ncbi:MAG: rubredoxin-like domain-containing protein [Peptococcaceae bacterium]
MCLNCGHLHRGKQVPAVCPVCSHNQGFFIKLDMAPWTC